MHGKVSCTYVYVHKCVEEGRIARRSDRTRCTRYIKDVGSNSELVNAMQMLDHTHSSKSFLNI